MSDHVAEVKLTLNILKDMGIVPQSKAKILDFGCGSGSAVYAFLDQGHENVYGYDIENYLNLRKEEDSQRFFFSDTDMQSHRESFDFIFSNQVFEHVMDYPHTIQQTYDLLKPGGVAVHLFPSKWRFIEPHIYVPLAGVFSSKAYLGFWAKMGVRNEFQKDKSWQEVRDINFKYCHNNLNYLSSKALLKEFQRKFARVEFREDLFIKHSPGRLRHFATLLSVFPGLDRLMREFHARTVVVQKYHKPSK